MPQALRVQAGFEQWIVFEKARLANRMRHAQAYEELAQFLSERMERPAAILDIGCGDARDMARLLSWVEAESYVGVDNNARVLEAARMSLAPLTIPWRLVHADFKQALRSGESGFDVIWLGLFLHHLAEAEKAAFFAAARAMLRPGGVVLAHDPVLFDGESRQHFLERLTKRCAQTWDELTDAEKAMLGRHWGQHGHQQSVDDVKRLALANGFAAAEALWQDPDRFYAVLAFWV